MNTFSFKAAAAAVALLVAGAANAAVTVNIFQDGFESPDVADSAPLTTWGGSGRLFDETGASASTDTPFGSQYASVRGSFISHVLNTAGGFLYDVSFYSTSNINNLLASVTGGSLVGALADTGVNVAGWEKYTFSFTASTYNSALKLSSRGGATFDNVSVTSTVPEPEAFAMLLAGLGAIGFMSRRRKSI
jgi:PEP-CTERM motif